MFERTKSGLSNRPKFYDCDMICFVEGSNDPNSINPDSTFWSAIFAAHKPNLKIVCLPRGGKPELEAIANDIIDKDVQGNLVAMDSDYDDYIGDKIEDPRILYTFGYSWENDVLPKSNMMKIFGAVTHLNPPAPDVHSELNDIMSEFETSAKRVMQADYLAICAKGSLIPRNSPGRIVKTHGKYSKPYICLNECRKLLREVNLKTKHSRNVSSDRLPDISERYFVRKVFIHYALRTVDFLIRKFFRRITLTANHFRDIALQGFQSFLILEPNHPISLFHKIQCKSIP